MGKKKQPIESEDNEDNFREHFPSIIKELSEGEQILEEEEIRTTTGSKLLRKFKGHTPSAIDFICRCSTEDEAFEIIEYMFNKGDITEDYAKELKRQLKDEGLESFGEHRKPGYYERF